MLLLRLSQVFRQGATIPPLHPNFFGFVIEERGIILLLRLSQRISSGCHHATPPPIFSNFHYCGKGALCFCFDLAKVFLQGATSPPLHPNFWGKVLLLWEGGIMLSFRLSQRISSGCHHATPKHKKFWIVIIVGRGIMLLLRLSQGISSGCNHATPTQPFFLEVSLWEVGIMLPLRLSQRNS